MCAIEHVFWGTCARARACTRTYTRTRACASTIDGFLGMRGRRSNFFGKIFLDPDRGAVDGCAVDGFTRSTVAPARSTEARSTDLHPRSTDSRGRRIVKEYARTRV